MNKKVKYILLLILVIILTESKAQLSVFNKIDTVKGYTTKVIPSGESIIVFSIPNENTPDSLKFRMTKFDECRDILWSRDYHSQDLLSFPVDNIDVITKAQDVYVLLKNSSYLMALVKMDKTGKIDWTKTIHSEDSNVFSEMGNLLINENNDVLFIVTADKFNNTVIFSLDLDGEILSSKKMNGFYHKASTLNARGDLVMFSKDSSYVCVDLDDEFIDTILWSKHLTGGYFFDELNDPIAVAGLGDTSIITAVVDTFTKKDTAIYRLVKFGENGKIIDYTKGFYSEEGKYFANNRLTFKKEDVVFPKSIYYMINNKVMFFTTDLVKTLNPKSYKFNDRDGYRVYDTSLEICDDRSLVMSGFCYKNNEEGEMDFESPYMFLSKTQPAEKQYVVESEEENCLQDSTIAEMIVVKKPIIDNADFSLDTTKIIIEDIDTFKFDVIDGLMEEKCGKINMDEKHDTVSLCPGQDAMFMAPQLDCSGERFLWSTGDTGPVLNKVHEAGEYIVTVTFCDSVKVSSFVYKYREDRDKCFKIYYPNAFFPSANRDSINSIFKVAIDTDYKKGEGYNFTSFEFKIFDRWGEKVFETTDPEEGWDGTFRGKDMAPGVYLYNVNWNVDINGVVEYKDSSHGQVMLLR